MQRTGALEATVLRLFSRRCEVQKVEAFERFRLVTLGGDDLVGRSWTAGHMIQISFGNWESRAYTPLTYDVDRGMLDFIGYVHGGGMASAWLDSLRIGEPCTYVGPRAAMNLDTAPRPLVVFGDETSFSTAAALNVTKQGYRGVTFVFEVTSPAECAPMLERLGLTDAIVVQRAPGEAHLEIVEAHVLDALRSSTARAVFTGKAASIARLYKAARREGIPGKRITNIAYWAPGRKGFSGVQR